MEAAFDALGDRVPLVISGTITDASGRTLSGQTVEAFWTSVDARAADRRRAQLRAGRAPAARPHRGPRRGSRASRSAPTRTPACPTSSAATTSSPATTAELLGQYARDGLVNIVGGCCGTTPAHVRAIAEAVAGVAPRAIPVIERKTRLSGLQALTIPQPGGVFVNVGERTNVTGSRKFARLILEDRFDEARRGRPPAGRGRRPARST